MNEGKREDLLINQMIELIPRLRRFARGLTKDTDKADDLVQDACERILKKSKWYGKEPLLVNLLHRIIYNRWIDKLRRQKVRMGKLIILSEQTQTNSPDTRSGSNLDVALDLQRALDKLDEEQRAAILLVCVEGYSYAEAATVLEVPPGTVASRVARAREKLGKLMFNGPEISSRFMSVNKMRKENEPEI